MAKQRGGRRKRTGWVCCEEEELEEEGEEEEAADFAFPPRAPDAFEATLLAGTRAWE
jgi:hypothetical protein